MCAYNVKDIRVLYRKETSELQPCTGETKEIHECVTRHHFSQSN